MKSSSFDYHLNCQSINSTHQVDYKLLLCVLNKWLIDKWLIMSKLDELEWNLYFVNTTNCRVKGQRKISQMMDLPFISDLYFRQTGLNQSLALTYKSLSESRQLKDVWQGWKLSISHPEVLCLFWDSFVNLQCSRATQTEDISETMWMQNQRS